RFVEVVRGGLGKRSDRPDEIRDPGAVEVRLEVAEAIVSVRVDRKDGDTGACQRPSTEADRRLALPRADLDDHAPSGTRAREIVERLAFFVRQPAGNLRDERFDVHGEVVHGPTCGP